MSKCGNIATSALVNCAERVGHQVALCYEVVSVLKTLINKMLIALFFEMLENIPLFLGGTLAVWLGSVKGMWPLAALSAMAGCGLGALLIQYGEKYQNLEYVATRHHLATNFVAFLVCIALALLYFHFVPVGWIDVLAGIILGGVMTVLQGLASNNLTSWLTHGLSMAIASGIGLVVLRGILTFSDLTAVIVATLVLIAVVSLIITAIEYWPGFVQLERPQHESPEQL